MRPALAFATLLLLAGAVTAQEAPPAPTRSDAQSAAPAPQPPLRCRALTVYRIFDFLLGKWDVTINGMPAGTTRFQLLAKGCAILETRIDGANVRSQSFYYYLPETQRWKQIWVSEQALAPNGVMELELVELLDEGSIRLQGKGTVSRRTIHERTTLEPMPDGSARQIVETSADGKNWRRVLESIYRKQPPRKRP